MLLYNYTAKSNWFCSYMEAAAARDFAKKKIDATPAAVDSSLSLKRQLDSLVQQNNMLHRYYNYI